MTYIWICPTILLTNKKRESKSSRTKLSFKTQFMTNQRQKTNSLREEKIKRERRRTSQLPQIRWALQSAMDNKRRKALQKGLEIGLILRIKKAVRTSMSHYLTRNCRSKLKFITLVIQTQRRSFSLRKESL